MAGYFKLPVNLVHAATVAVRVSQRVSQCLPDEDGPWASLDIANQIVSELAPYRIAGDEPNPAESMVVQAYLLDLCRDLVVAIECEGAKSDRVGQAVRNLFECLGRGEEGAMMGLRAGEDPNSIQRP